MERKLVKKAKEDQLSGKEIKGTNVNSQNGKQTIRPVFFFFVSFVFPFFVFVFVFRGEGGRRACKVVERCQAV